MSEVHQVKTAVEWTRAEFMEGMVRMGYDSIEKVKAGLSVLQVSGPQHLLIK